MEKNIAYLMLPLLLTLSLNAYAGVGSGQGTIDHLYINDAGTIVRVGFSEPIKNPDGCTKSTIYLHLLSNDDASSRFLSALLTAYTTKSTVSFWVSGCTSAPWWGGSFPDIHDIYMY